MLRSAGRKIMKGTFFALAEELSYFSWFFLTLNGRRLPSYSDSYEFVGAKEYSREWLKKHRPQPRTRVVLQLLASLPFQTRGNLLILGPRYENEIFFARGLGWNRDSVYALDLLSYSKRVVQGDVHNAPFANEKFRSIAAPWVISYSHNPQLFASEIERILEPNGVVIFGVDFSDKNSKEELEIPRGKRRLQTKGQFQALFPNFYVIFESTRHNDSSSYIIIMQKNGKEQGVA